MIDESCHSLEAQKRHALEDAHRNINDEGLVRRVGPSGCNYVWFGAGKLIGIHHEEVVTELHDEGLIAILKTTPCHTAQITETGLMSLDVGGLS